ncbi:methylated-DNA--[protein]-cysteine S-methyltransferase [Desulfurivibrio sp. D14AmB]|uniref:methylated-DNA--[protein]-cysteine S-methyltransferase n=1 Tax=Desulfurivibrio sp. D14AmB TaxID=3374370 RepID=UPI00376F0D8C
MPPELKRFLTLCCPHPQLTCWFILADGGPVRVDFLATDHRRAVLTLRQWGAMVGDGSREAGSAAIRLVQQHLAAYLAGESRCFFADPPPSPFLAAGSGFQQEVWRQIAAIPYGETRSYGEIGQALGDHNLARAVGGACGANPCPLLIPCHRVVGKNSLGGFTGGIEIKKLLLTIEG